MESRYKNGFELVEKNSHQSRLFSEEKKTFATLHLFGSSDTLILPEWSRKLADVFNAKPWPTSISNCVKTDQKNENKVDKNDKKDEKDEKDENDTMEIDNFSDCALPQKEKEKNQNGESQEQETPNETLSFWYEHPGGHYVPNQACAKPVVSAFLHRFLPKSDQF